MNDVDRQIVTSVALELPLTQERHRTLGEATEIGQAALLLGTDETAIEEWFERYRGEGGPMARVLARAADRADVADLIDDTLDDDPTVLADLMRATIAWNHPSIPDLLDRPDYRGPALWMLMQVEPERVEAWLEGERDPDDVVEAARIAGSLGCADLFDTFFDWWEPFAEARGHHRRRLESSLFLMDPERWSRAYVGGELEAEFLSDGVAVADVLTAAGASYFSEILAVVHDDAIAFESLSRLAVAGAAARFAARLNDESEPADVLQAVNDEDFALLTTHPAFRVATCLADDDDLLQGALLDAAAGDLLYGAGADSPGIGGFPLSPTFPMDEEIDAALHLLRKPGRGPDDELFLVATLVDLARLTPSDPERFAPHIAAAKKLVDDDRTIVSRAARWAVEPTPPEELGRRAAGDDMRAYAAAEKLARRADEPALRELIELWSQRGALLRAPLYSMLIFDVLRQI